MGDSSLPETRPVVALSLAELQARFATPVSLSPDDVARLAARIPILRRRYNEHLQRAKIQFVDPRLTLTSCRSLLLLGRATVGVSHLVYQALRSLDDAIRTPTKSTVAPEVVEVALDWSDRQIELIAWQLRALDAADTQSATLRALFGQMELHARLTPAGWTRLTNDVISAATGWLDRTPAMALKTSPAVTATLTNTPPLPLKPSTLPPARPVAVPLPLISPVLQSEALRRKTGAYISSPQQNGQGNPPKGTTTGAQLS